MPINIKHCIAIGLGIGVTAAYCLHLKTIPQTSIPFQQPSVGLQSLSNFDSSGIPKLDTLNPSAFAKLHHDPLAGADPSEQLINKPPASSFAPPAVDDFETTASLTDQEPLVTDLTVPAAFGSSNIDAANSEPNQIELVSSRQQPGLPVINHDSKFQSRSSRTGWQKNPFTSKSPGVLPAENSNLQMDPLLEDLSPAASAPQTPTDNRLEHSNAESSFDLSSFDLNETSPAREQETSVLENSAPENDGFADPVDALSDSSNRVADTQLDVSIVRSQDQQFQRQAMDQQAAPLNQQALQSDVIKPRIEISNTIAKQAAQRIEYGKSLCRRGALFAARQEFFLALNIIAQSRDESSGGQEHSRALSRGFLALKEAEGFVVDNIEAGSTLDVASVVETHRCNVMTTQEAEMLTPAQATHRYIEFAKQQLDQACGRNVVSAEAFFCLGKLYTAVSKTRSVPSNLDSSKSIAFHEAALQSDEKNYRSSNELGVLMAQSGRMEEAKRYLKKSLIVHRTPQAWQNLAMTHRQLGEVELAELAESEFAMASQAPIVNSTSPIQWVPTESFSTAAPFDYQPRVASNPESRPTPSAEQSKIKSITKSFSERLKEFF